MSTKPGYMPVSVLLIPTIVQSISKLAFLPLPKDSMSCVIGLLILSTIAGISNADTGIDPGLVDIESTAVILQDFKRQVTPPDL